MQILSNSLQRTAKRNMILAQASQLMQQVLDLYALMERLSTTGQPSVSHPSIPQESISYRFTVSGGVSTAGVGGVLSPEQSSPFQNGSWVAAFRQRGI